MAGDAFAVLSRQGPLRSIDRCKELGKYGKT